MGLNPLISPVSSQAKSSLLRRDSVFPDQSLKIRDLQCPKIIEVEMLLHLCLRNSAIIQLLLIHYSIKTLECITILFFKWLFSFFTQTEVVQPFFFNPRLSLLLTLLGEGYTLKYFNQAESFTGRKKKSGKY